MKSLRTSPRLMFALPLGLLLLFNSAFAGNHALVVGVSAYPNLDEHLQLAGPRYDAEMVSEFLRTNRYRRFDGPIVLADGIEGAAVPTRTAILTALDAIAVRAKRGDFVYLHFSGHGSRAPAIHPEDETDGLDELFLPADTRLWNDAIGKVENAILDDELGEKITAIRNRGAFVWAVFDSCHSGTVTRGAPSGEGLRYRRVAESLLGIPDEAMRLSDSTRLRGVRQAQPSQAPAMPDTLMRGMPATGEESGGFVAFYAAQSTETTPEMRLPAGAPGRVSHGLFSFTLFKVIAEHPGITYRQAAQEILQRYAASYMVSPTPLFEGTLDAQVFDVEPQAVIPQWPLRAINGRLTIAAGHLHGLAKGQRLVVVPGPAAGSDEKIAVVEVASLTTFKSVVAVVAWQGKPAAADEQLPAGAYARLIDKPVSFAVRVARPEYTGDATGTAAKRIATVIRLLDEPENAGLRLEWVAAGDSADIRLGWTGQTDTSDERLWLLPPTGELITEGIHKTPSISLGDKSDNDIAVALGDDLARMARVTNLLRLSEVMGPAAIAAHLRILRQGEEQLTAVDPSQVPNVRPGDEIHITAHNPGKEPVDINVLFIGSDYSIAHMYKERIHPGNTLNAGLVRITDTSFGTERVMVIATPSDKQTEVQDFAFLQQRAMPKSRAYQDRMTHLLADAGFGQTKRGAAPLRSSAERPGSAILQFAVSTLPAN
jgi:hypothetical protein